MILQRSIDLELELPAWLYNQALLTANPGLPYLVFELEAFANNKAIDGALKQVH